jgi:hypothetical protein
MHLTIEHNPDNSNLGLSYGLITYEDNGEIGSIFTIGLLFINMNFIW